MAVPPAAPEETGARIGLPANRSAPSQARAFVRAVIAERALAASAAGPKTDRLADEAALLVTELVTNAFIHAGTDIEVRCTPRTATAATDATPPEATPPDATPPDPTPPDLPGRIPADDVTGVHVEVVDRQPAGRVPGQSDALRGRRGLGLQVVGALAHSWGVTYHRDRKAVWFRLDATQYAPTHEGSLNEVLYHELVRGGYLPPPARAPQHRTEWAERSGAFLAEASELLSGQLDEDMVAALAGQLLVPRLADWCAVWLATDAGQPRLARVWHRDERSIAPLRRVLAPDPPPADLPAAGTPWPWPADPAAGDEGGSALAFSLIAAGAGQGTLVVGRAGRDGVTDGAAHTVEDVARRVAQALLTARQYTQQTSISRALQRRQLPSSLARLPGIESAVVYEPHARGQTVGGDFYDLFPIDDQRWCFLLGDVQGKDAEAMSVTGLTRQLVRLLAREGHGVESVLSRINGVMAEESAEAVAVGGESARPRFLSLVYGELEPDPHAGGATCTLASAGHPPPLRLSADGAVAAVAGSQLLLGIDEDAEFTADGCRLAPGDTLLCVTDGVTERRNGTRQLDDNDGLAGILQGCTGMGAMAVAEHVRQAAHDFGPEPVEDDLAVLVLHAVPRKDGLQSAPADPRTRQT